MNEGRDTEIRRLSYKAEVAGHIGFCFGRYRWDCVDCPTEVECLKLFLKEKREKNEREL